MSPEAIVQSIVEFLEKRGVAADKIASCDDLFKAGMLDSISAVRLALHLERTFNVRIGASEISYDRFRNLESIRQFVESKGRQEKSDA